MPNKIFGIGLSKTGTSSLTQALRILGYSTNHFPFSILQFRNERLALKPERLRRYNAYTDSPVARFFPEIDRYYPGSKFILTVRHLDSWLNSCRMHHIWPGDYLNAHLFRQRTPLLRRVMQLHEDMYGSASFDWDSFAHAYTDHTQKVKTYFKDRPQDILVIDICSGEGWEKLCEFLNREIPACHFPKQNVGAEKKFKRTYRKYFWKSLAALSTQLKSG